MMAVIGWSSTGMARRYLHVTDTIRHTVANQVDGLLWESADGPEEASPEGN